MGTIAASNQSSRFLYFVFIAKLCDEAKLLLRACQGHVVNIRFLLGTATEGLGENENVTPFQPLRLVDGRQHHARLAARFGVGKQTEKTGVDLSHAGATFRDRDESFGLVFDGRNAVLMTSRAQAGDFLDAPHFDLAEK